jgi:hypothetical protein
MKPCRRERVQRGNRPDQNARNICTLQAFDALSHEINCPRIVPQSAVRLSLIMVGNDVEAQLPALVDAHEGILTCGALTSRL